MPKAERIDNKEVKKLIKDLKNIVEDMQFISRKAHLKYRLTMENRLGSLENITVIIPTTPKRRWKKNWISQLRNKMRDKDIATRILQSIA